MHMPLTYTLLYLVYNQAELLEPSLRSLRSSASNILLVDLSSTEDIRGLAKRYGTQYHRLPYSSIVEPIRPQAFALAKTDYILYLDGDESVPPTLLAELTKVQAGGYTHARLARQNLLFGKKLDNSRWWPDYQLRFFDRTQVKWSPHLHHPPVAEGRGLDLPPIPSLSILHQNYRTIDEWLAKNQRYAKIDAQARLTAKDPFTLTQALQLSLSEIMSRYYYDRGYRDALHGLMLALLQSFYYLLVYAYYWEGKKYQEGPNPPPYRRFFSRYFSTALSEALYWEQKSSGTILEKLRNKLIRKVIYAKKTS